MPTLFIAEDDPLMRRIYERIFRQNGYDVMVAFDGEETLATLRKMETPPVAAILDVMMPKKSGFDVLKEMKADEKLKNIPVVLFTNLAGEEDANKGLAMGAKLYLIKSQYSPKEVVQKVQEVIAASPKK